MTKRDVCIWFCKVVAIVGMVSAGFSFINTLLNLSLFGVSGLLLAALQFGFYLFVWFFSGSIGTELAAEGEYGAPLSSVAELGSMMLRCVGLWLFLSASLRFGPTFLVWAYERFTATNPSPIPGRLMMSNLMTEFMQSVVGFLLAFTPRIRAALGK